MRPSRACKPEELVDNRSGESTKPKQHRLRRRRKGKTQSHDENDDSQEIQEVITRKEPTPLIESRTFSRSSLLPSRTRSDEMPSGDSLSSVGNGPKLTKTGRVSKARKGVKGAHRCACGKVCTLIWSTRIQEPESLRHLGRYRVYTPHTDGTRISC